jgi:hypothetical protein
MRCIVDLNPWIAARRDVGIGRGAVVTPLSVAGDWNIADSKEKLPGLGFELPPLILFIR